jgi:hypothetical protein
VAFEKLCKVAISRMIFGEKAAFLSQKGAFLG